MTSFSVCIMNSLETYSSIVRFGTVQNACETSTFNAIQS